MNEEWRDIAISNGGYQISNLGRVRSVCRVALNCSRHVHERILKTRVNKSGYEYVCIQVNGKRKAVKIHREVAKAFLDNPNGYEEVNHKDEVKTNNNVNNLEWCTRKYNANYGTTKLRAVENRLKSYHNEVEQYSLDGSYIRTWNCPAQVEHETNKAMRKQNIVACCHGKYKTSYGYVWKYANSQT